MDSPALFFSRPSASVQRWVAGGIVALAAAAYVFLIASHMGAYAGGSDSSGYLNSALLLREGRLSLPQRALPGLPLEQLPPYTYVPLGFRPEHGHDLVATYPIGLPLLVVAVSAITGWEAAPHWTMGLHALAGVALMYLLARQVGLSRTWAGLGVLLLALSPLYLFMSVQMMSDVPALVWTLAAIILAWRSRDDARARWPFAAGGAFALAVLVRPNNLLALAPLAAAFGLNWRRWLLFGCGGLPGALGLAIYQHASYGAALASGYGEIFSVFMREVFNPTLAHYARWMPVLLTPLGIFAAGLPWLARALPRWTALLALWVAVYLVFFAFYFHTHETWWYLRFLLPAFPAFIIAALLVLRHLTRTVAAGPRQWILAMGLLGLVLIWSRHWVKKLDALSIGHGEAVYSEAARWAQTHLPASAVIATMQTSGALHYYTDFTLVRWDQLPPKDVAAVYHALGAAKRPLFAVLFPFEEKDALEKRLPGPWTKIGAVRHVTIWRCEAAALIPSVKS
jgi:hypothetical protein